MSNIQIFVSHRIDIESELIDNPIYVPVRCGAVFDQQNTMHILGDDTGENISERRMSFCEFTVQYWAWKNIDADYYGLCHYRRYLSFSEKHFKTDEYNMVHESNLTPFTKKKYALLDKMHMEKVIEQYDIITSEYAPVSRIPFHKQRLKNVRGVWEDQNGIFFEKSSVELLFRLIDAMKPEFSVSAREYFDGNLHRGFNCFILKKELFYRLCEFQFPIIFEIERRLDTTGYTQTMMRTPAFMGEMLYGIFMYHVTTKENWKVKELQLVFFSNTEVIKGRIDLAKRCTWSFVDKWLRVIIDPIMPKGTRRRELLKSVFYKITPAKQRGVANIKK